MDDTQGTFEEFRAQIEAPEMREIFSGILPDRTNVDAWIASSIETVRRTRDAKHASPESTIGVLITAASLGLRLEGVLGQAYLTVLPIRGKDKRGKWTTLSYQTQLQVGYLGLIRMALRNPEVLDCEARMVCHGDDFTFEFGSQQQLHHTWDHRRPRGAMVAVYAALRHRGGYYKYSGPYGIDEVYKVQERALRSRSIIGKDDGRGKREWYFTKYGNEEKMSMEQKDRTPWISHFEQMAMKTSVHWASKYWNIGETFDRAAALIAMDDTGVSQEMDAVTHQYMSDARRARVIGAAGTAGTTGGGWGSEPTAPEPPRPMAGAQGEALRAQMVAEATDAPPDGDITADEAAEILAQERAEAEAFRLSMEHGEDD